MNIRKYQPGGLHPLESLFSEWNRLSPHWWPVNQGEEGKAAPTIDIEERDDSYVVHADLPGVSKDDIQVSVDDGVLTIAGTVQSDDEEEKEGQYLRRERYRGSYMRKMSLGQQIDESKIEASFRDGVLELTIPRVEPRKPESLTVRVK